MFLKRVCHELLGLVANRLAFAEVRVKLEENVFFLYETDSEMKLFL
jgi:hypothetical protein